MTRQTHGQVSTQPEDRVVGSRGGHLGDGQARPPRELLLDQAADESLADAGSIRMLLLHGCDHHPHRSRAHIECFTATEAYEPWWRLPGICSSRTAWAPTRPEPYRHTGMIGCTVLVPL